MEEAAFLQELLVNNLEKRNVLLYGDFPSTFMRRLCQPGTYSIKNEKPAIPYRQGTNYIFKKSKGRYYNFQGIKNCYFKGNTTNCIHNREALITFLSNNWLPEYYHRFSDGKISFSADLSSLQKAERNTYLLLPALTDNYHDGSSENELEIEPFNLFPNGFVLVVSPSRGKIDEFISLTDFHPKKSCSFGIKVLSGVKTFHVSSHKVEQLRIFLQKLPASKGLNRFVIACNSLAKFDNTIIELAEAKNVRIIATQSLAKQTREDRNFFRAGNDILNNFGIVVRDGAYCEYLRKKRIVFDNPVPSIKVVEDQSENSINRNRLLNKVSILYKKHVDCDILKRFYWSILRTPIYYDKSVFNSHVALLYESIPETINQEISDAYNKWFESQKECLNEEYSVSQTLIDSVDEQGEITLFGWVAKSLLEELVTENTVRSIKFILPQHESSIIKRSAASIVNNKMGKRHGLISDPLYQDVTEDIICTGDVPKKEMDYLEDDDVKTTCIAADGKKINVTEKSYWVMPGNYTLQHTQSSMIPPNAFLIEFTTEQEGAEDGLEEVQQWRSALIEYYGDDTDACKNDLRKMDIRVVKGTIMHWLDEKSEQIAPKKSEHFEKILEHFCGITDAADRERLWDRAERIRSARRIDGRERIVLARDFLVDELADAKFNWHADETVTLYHNETLTKIVLTKICGIINGVEYDTYGASRF